MPLVTRLSREGSGRVRFLDLILGTKFFVSIVKNGLVALREDIYEKIIIV